jgi:predicted  nucleic acid-binding Zn-ribbon protein
VVQFTKLAAATRLWQQEECGHAMELERLAGELDSRERIVAVREQRLLVAEDQCRQRERDLWAFRVKLEGWQAGLTAHESRWYAERDRVDAEIDHERERLAAWEQSLQSICATWQELRSKERESLLSEINNWQQDRSEYVTALADLDIERTALSKQATLLAARMTATEEAAATVDPKRLRVLQKKWESHFRRLEKLWAVRQTAAAKLASGLEAKITTLKSETAKTTSKRIEKAAQQQEQDRTALIANRQLAEVSEVSIRPRRGDRELHELRNEVERISAVLMNTPMSTGEEAMIALAPARAA